MAQRPAYASREQVMRRADIKYTAWSASLVDDALFAAARTIEKTCQRPHGLFPSLKTIYREWPAVDEPTSWRLWLDECEAISLVSLSSAGVAITGSLLEDNTAGPPYKQLQLNRAGSSYFGGGSTPQRSITITLWTGVHDEQRPAGTLASAISTTSAVTMVVSNGALGVVGVGNQLIIDSERFVVTDRSMSSTGTTLSSGIDAAASTVTVPVASGAAVNPGETILVDSERMLVVDIAGNNLTVKRAFDGSVIAAHLTGATVYSPRTLTVERGAQGTTAATHAQGAAIYRWDQPADAQRLNIAEALNTLQQDQAAWARMIGNAEFAREVSAKGLKDARESVYGSGLRRKGRAWAI